LRRDASGDQDVNVTMTLVADRRFVVIIVASFACKTSVGQQPEVSQDT
jgi:hypothetical protein